MATFNWPASVYPSSPVDWHLGFNSQGFQGPLGGPEQIAELMGARWSVSLKFEHLKRHEIATLEALIFKLRGRANQVLLWDHFRANPRGTGLGSPLVMGAGQNGSSIISDGWTSNQLGALLEADRIAINGEFKAVTSDVDTDGAGQATIQFEPPLRYSPPDNSVITIQSATAKMMLINDNQGKLSTRRSLTSTPLVFVEDIS